MMSSGNGGARSVCQGGVCTLVCVLVCVHVCVLLMEALASVSVCVFAWHVCVFQFSSSVQRVKLRSHRGCDGVQEFMFSPRCSLGLGIANNLQNRLTPLEPEYILFQF